jgi:hypothetical protein
MFGYILMPLININLYFGMVKDNENLLNIGVFLLWVYALVGFFAMFAKDEDILKESDKSFLVKWSLTALCFGTIAHAVYWGYIVAPAVWLLAMFVLWARKYQVHNQKRF